jgi:copper transport protein
LEAAPKAAPAAPVVAPLAAPVVALLAVLTLALLVGWSAPAWAHAVLAEAQPADRSALAGPPDEVRLTFSEPVDAATGALRVFDAEAQRIDLGPRSSPDPAVVAVALPPDLPDGGYVATYRVTSADSHVVAGVLTFTVGDAQEVGDELVAELFGGAGSGPAGVLGPLLRGLGYVATLLAAGAIAIAGGVLRRTGDRALARRVARGAAVVGLAVAVVAVPVQAAAVTGDGLVGGLAPGALGEVVTTSFGTATLVRIVGLLVLLVGWRPGAEGSLGQAAVPALGAALAVGSFLLDGHQRSMEPTALLVAADAVHLTAGAVWFAGLVLLVPALRRPSALVAPVHAGGPAPVRAGAVAAGAPAPVRPDADAGAGVPAAAGDSDAAGDADAADAPAAAGVVARFSSLAFVTALAVLASGAAMSSVLVGSPAALTSTSYGRTLLLKLGAVAVVLLLAMVNRQRLVPAIVRRDRDAGADAAWGQLHRTVRVEALLVVAVLLVTGMLVSQRPAALEAGLAGSLQTAAPLTDDLAVDLVIDPNRAGLNTLHLYVVEPTGRPTDTVEELRLELTYLPEGIGPIELELFPVGPGHWTGTVDAFAFPGSWEVRVIAAVGRFEDASVTLPVTVAP